MLMYIILSAQHQQKLAKCKHTISIMRETLSGSNQCVEWCYATFQIDLTVVFSEKEDCSALWGFYLSLFMNKTLLFLV